MAKRTPRKRSPAADAPAPAEESQHQGWPGGRPDAYLPAAPAAADTHARQWAESDPCLRQLFGVLAAAERGSAIEDYLMAFGPAISAVRVALVRLGCIAAGDALMSSHGPLIYRLLVAYGSAATEQEARNAPISQAVKVLQTQDAGRVAQDAGRGGKDAASESRASGHSVKKGKWKSTSSSKQTQVSEKMERLIATSITQLPPGSTQREVAERAGVSEKTVGRSNAWKGRRVASRAWGAGHTEDDRELRDQMLDIENLLAARKHLLHAKTKVKLERQLADRDLRDRLLTRLIEVETESQPLKSLPDETYRETIRSTIERVSVDNTDNCPS